MRPFCTLVLARVPALHAAEFGTLQPPHSSEASPEPGAFGAAWTASNWLVGLQLGFDEFYHWTDSDDVKDERAPLESSPPKATLLYGWAIAMAFAELLFDADASSTTVNVLNTTLPMEVKDAKRARNTTSVAGVSTTTSTARNLLLAAFDPAAYFGNDTTVSVSLSMPLEAIPGVAKARGAPQVSTTWYVVDGGNAVYDRIYQDLDRIGGLSRTDGHVYKLKHLANNKGMHYVEHHTDTYVALQDSILSKQPFPGTLSQNDTHVVLHFDLAYPSVAFLALGAPVEVRPAS